MSVICVTFRPDAEQIAASTLNGYISFYDVETCTQTGSISGRPDLELSLKDQDKVSAKKLSFGRFVRIITLSVFNDCVQWTFNISYKTLAIIKFSCLIYYFINYVF